MRWPKRNAVYLGIAVFVLFAFLTVVTVWLITIVPNYQTAHITTGPLRIQFDAENEARKTLVQIIMTLAQILGGIGIFVGVYIGFRRVKSAEKNVRVLQEGQITERYTRAIDQLGNDEPQIRLGGIYALERIARDSQKDHLTIMEVLTAYIRERAKWIEPSNNAAEGEESVEGSDENENPKPSVDMQAALTVIGRRNLAHEDESTPMLDIRKTDLRGGGPE